MSSPGPLYRPFDRLVKIEIMGRVVEIPENNTLLRGLQFLAPEDVAMGRFCWNEDCQYCRVTYDVGHGTAKRAALACKVGVQEGMRIRDLSLELRYCLRSLKLPSVAAE
jgi:NADH dehydrogenase/NADH:ubiquinone oxidoreductase subunit G